MGRNKEAIDLVEFIPGSINNYKLEKEINGNTITLWYKHPRIKLLTLNRFVDVAEFGAFLGQLQAEGTKSGKWFRLDFCNKTIIEHKEYISFLAKLGIPNDKICCEMMIHKKSFQHEKWLKHIFAKITKINVKYTSRVFSGKGDYGFKTYVRSTILTTLILTALEKLRKQMIIGSIDNASLLNNFLKKLLCGDGTLDARYRNRMYPDVSIKVVDQKLEYLKDYKTLLEKVGFKPKVVERRIWVKSGCSFLNLLYLYKIRGFEWTGNWKKLLVTIAICLQSPKCKVYKRFGNLKNHSFTSLDIASNYNIVLRSANDWINNMKNANLIEQESLYHGPKQPIRYKLSNKATVISKLIKKFEKEIVKLELPDSVEELYRHLASLKDPKRVKSSKKAAKSGNNL